MSQADTTAQWFDHPSGYRLACNVVPGSGTGVVFLGGYASDMTGTKATFLDQWCRERGCPYLRFDYRGHGQSDGTFEDGTIGAWSDDALAVFDAMTEGPQVLVGSSMGGWIMLNLALKRPERIAGLVGIAAAPDFSQGIWWNLSDEQRETVMREGGITLDEGGSNYGFSRAFFEDGRDHLRLQGPLALDSPVRLLQGMRDDAVPWETALTIARCLTTDDVVVDLVKDGDHRLSRDEDLARLGRTIAETLDRQES
ncbi:MAG: alpha/beta hydrolase [Rhodospirillales bacterium]|nr:alpha/beta hydrolase [Rhodospirillales bacterium]